MESISLSTILQDPITYGIALLLFALFWGARKYVWPKIKQEGTIFFGPNMMKVMTLLTAVLRAVEQVRLKGDLNAFVAMFGYEIDLSDNVAIRTAIVDYVQEQLSHYTWGKNVSAEDILVLLHELMREDAHKGAVTQKDQYIEQLEFMDPETIAKNFSKDLLQAALGAQKTSGLIKSAPPMKGKYH